MEVLYNKLYSLMIILGYSDIVEMADTQRHQR